MLSLTDLLHIFLVDFLKREWEKLKENYRKCIQKREKATRSGAGRKTLPTCNFFEELAFIRDTVSKRKCETNLTTFRSDELDSESVSFESNDFTAPISPGNTSAVSATSSKSSTSRKRKSQQQFQTEVDTMIYDALKKDALKVEDQVDVKLDDPNKLFCLSLVDELKSLNHQQNILARIKIQQVLYDIRYLSS